MSFRDTSGLHYWGPDDDIITALQRDYPRWRVWRGLSEQGKPTSWYATRACQPTLTAEQEENGLCCTLAADTSEDLEKLLQRQEELIARLSEPILAAS